MQNRRKAFDKLCPNRIAAISNRGTRKPERKVSRRIFGDPPGPVTIYVDQSPNTVDAALSAIDWQDLADCNSVIQQDADRGSVTQQGPCLQSEPEFDLQEFRDAVDSFIDDQTAHMQTGMGAANFLLLPPDGPAFEPCMVPHIHAPQLTPINVQPIPSTEQFWRDMADQNQKALGDALVQNNQLHVSLNEKQEEIACLKEKNVQLKELANQAKHLASVLDELMSQRSADNPSLSSEGLLSRPPVKRSLEEFYPQTTEQECNQVDEILREISEKCKAALMGSAHSEAKRPKLFSEDPVEGQGEVTTTIKMCGAFQGLKTSTGHSSVSLSNTDLEEDVTFRTSIKDHCTIRTLAFPQGNAFTIRTNEGGYKFRWVPN
ncbi:multicilin [Hyla sarda]|uniref:multicilin n=1 Tax=Hyla sarda TaxID=327740 RepID=UPI0024C2749F|nr:multicilin [Hyla sarda]XP_056398358.1 multicilin [Hyla sarda]XP_056398366.1 multicilin [Hyla sarda]XP_056398375.1 multicilin [Hyla sarda]